MKNENPYGVARVNANTRTYRADTAENDVDFNPAAANDTDATSVNDDPSVDTWILYDDANAASHTIDTDDTCCADPKSTCHH